MEYVLALFVLSAAVAAVVLWPVLRGVGEETRESVDRAELEAAKQAKYREIRDAKLDLEMGKLSEDDHRAINRELRAEAIEILAQLEEVEGRAPGSTR